MKRFSIHQAETHFPRLIQEAESGQEIVICRGSLPVAQFVPYQKGARAKKRPRVGIKTSALVRYTEDAFAALSEKELAEWGLS